MGDSILDNGFTGEQIPEPTYPQYTNLALGSGLFDQLMKAVKSHIHEEYAGQRIRGAEYGQVYLGSMESVLQNATTYLLGILLTEQQRGKLTAETSLLAKQEEQIDANIELVELEKEKLRFTIEQLFPLEKQKLEAEIIRITNEGLLIESQIDKINEEILNLAAQRSLWAKQEEKIVGELALMAAQTALALKQVDKIEREILLIDAKTSTELANTTDNFTDGSLIGHQTKLLNAQRLGFQGDLYIKAAKVHSDYDAVYESVEEVGLATISSAAAGHVTSAAGSAGAM